MFIDEEGKKQIQEEMAPLQSQSFFSSKRNIILLVVLFLFLVAAVITVMLYLANSQGQPPVNPGNIATTTDPLATSTPETQATSTISVGLPQDLGGEGGDNGVTLIDTTKGEVLAFGSFYKKIDDEFEYDLETYDLPINTKTDIANYFEFNRAIDIENQIEDLNTKGFAVLDNQFSEQASDFYAVYDFLSEKDLPLFVSSDFMLYYKQNVFKKVFKEIEGNVFYDNLWDINDAMYNKAKLRYERLISEHGVVNNPVIEAARTELVYFAVALRLLEPKEGQIIEKDGLVDKNMFTIKEAQKFSPSFPAYLSGQVNQEYDLIKKADSKIKSPALVYEKDYSIFKVPAEYRENARLNNFYITSKWLNSLFPLYYQGSLCPECLLDKDDWRVSMIASCFISKDIADSQETKNKWAVIYKVLSFFTGLRSDLNYLHYQNKLISLYGEDYNIEELFAADNPDSDRNLSELQKEVISFNFLDIEGGRDRRDPESLPYLGFKVLADAYWPDDYIFRRLNYPNTGAYLGSDIQTDKPITLCSRSKNRCKGIGLDVINLISPISDNVYFSQNSNYEKYNDQLSFLSGQLDEFTEFNWHNSNFWANLDISKSLLFNQEEELPIFMQNDSWKQKDLQTSLGSWVNVQLPMDKLVYYQGGANSLGSFSRYNEKSYVEPRLDLVRELRSNTTMLLDMLSALGVVNETNSVLIDLKDLNEKLLGIEDVIKKELAGESLNSNDHENIENFVKGYTVSAKGNKKLNLKFKDYNDESYIQESVDGVKLLIAVYQDSSSKYLTIGPIFNYQEK